MLLVFQFRAIYIYEQECVYIITQGPMESICTDFWKMVHSRKCGVIVMTSDFQKEGSVNKN